MEIFSFLFPRVRHFYSSSTCPELEILSEQSEGEIANINIRG